MMLRATLLPGTSSLPRPRGVRNRQILYSRVTIRADRAGRYNLHMPRHGTQVAPELAQDTETRLAPLFHVILFDDQEHTYEYVIEMVTRIFRKPWGRALEHAVEVDRTGRTILATCALEVAELRRDQIRGFGGDFRLGSVNSMQAVVEQAD